MAGLGMAGGLGLVGNAFMEGMQQGEDRKYLKEQRQRVVDEQKRADAEREGLKNIQTTEDYEVDNPDYVQPLEGIQPITKDDEGNDMPAVTPTPKTITKTRNRSAADIAMDTANVYKQSGNIAQYTANMDRAQKLTMDDANRQATALIANSENMSLTDYANAAASIFSSDKLPYSIKTVTPAEDGKSVTMTVQNDNNGVQKQVMFKDTATLTRTLQSMYQPETYNKILTAKAEAAAKAQEEIAKNPYQTIGAGGAAIDKRTGKIVYNNDNGLVPALDANGNPIINPDGEPALVRPAAGRAGAGAGASGKKPVVGAVPEVIEKTLKGNEAAIATANDLFRAFSTSNPGMPEESAAALAIRASTGGNRTKVFNPNTGMFDEYFNDVPTKDEKGNITGYGTGKTFKIQSHEYVPDSKNAFVTPDDAKAAVESMKKTLPAAQLDAYGKASTPEGYKAYVDNTNNAMAGVVQKAQADAAAVRSDDSLNPQQKAEKIQAIQNAVAAQQQTMLADLRRLDLVRLAGAKPTANNNTGAANPAAPAQLGSAVPQDAAKRAAEAQAAAKKQADDRAAKVKAEKDAQEAERKEIEGLTPQVIEQINDPKQASDLYAKYNRYMNAFQREAFQRRMSQLRRQQLGGQTGLKMG